MKTILAELDSIQTANAKGDAFERVVKRILETAPESRSQFKNAWLWDDYPDRGGAGIGLPFRASGLVASDFESSRPSVARILNDYSAQTST